MGGLPSERAFHPQSVRAGVSSSGNLFSVGGEHQVTMHHHPHREARPDGVGGLDIERPSDHLFAYLVEALRATGAQRLGNGLVTIWCRSGVA